MINAPQVGAVAGYFVALCGTFSQSTLWYSKALELREHLKSQHTKLMYLTWLTALSLGKYPEKGIGRVNSPRYGSSGWDFRKANGLHHSQVLRSRLVFLLF